MSFLETRKSRRSILFGGAGLVLTGTVLASCGGDDDDDDPNMTVVAPTKPTGSMGLKDPNLTPDATQAALLDQYEQENGTPGATPSDASPTPEFKG